MFNKKLSFLILLFLLGVASFVYGERILVEQPLMSVGFDGSLTNGGSEGGTGTFAEDWGYRTLVPSNLTSYLGVLIGPDSSSTANLYYDQGSQSYNYGSFVYEDFDYYQGSAEFWIRPNWDGDDSISHCVWKFAGDANNQVYLYKNASNVLLLVHDANSDYEDTTYDVSSWDAGDWHYVVCVWDVNNITNGTDYLTIYVDGSRVAGTSHTLSYPSYDGGNLYIGNNEGGIRDFNGIIAGRILNRVLSSTEVTTLYDSGDGSIDTFRPSFDTVWMSTFSKSDNNYIMYHRGQSVSATTTTSVTLTEAVSTRQWVDNTRIKVYDGTGYGIDCYINDGSIAAGDTSFNVDNGAAGAVTGLDDVGVSVDCDETYYADADNNTVHDVTTQDIGISAWVSLDSGSSSSSVLEKDYITDYSGYIFGVDTGVITMFISDGTDFYLMTGDSDIRDNKWHQIAGIIDRNNAANCKIYLDGFEDGTTNKTGTIGNVDSITNTSTLELGRSGGGNIFDGQIRDVVLAYPADITAADEMGADGEMLILATEPGDNTNYCNYEDYWECSDNTGTTITGINEDLTLTSSSAWSQEAFVTMNRISDSSFENGGLGGWSFINTDIEEVSKDTSNVKYDTRSLKIEHHIDISTVDTTTTPAGINQSFVRRIFYANGYYWAFYNDGTGVYYESSSDGTTWSGSATSVFTDTTIVYDAWAVRHIPGTTRVVATFSTFAATSVKYFRRGTLGAGSISWDSADITIHSGNFYANMDVTEDSDGYPIVIGHQIVDEEIYEFRNDATDGSGSWSGPDEVIARTGSGCYGGCIFNIGGGDLYAIAPDNDTFGTDECYGALYDGSWQAEDTIAQIDAPTSVYARHHYAAVQDSNGDIHLVFRDGNDDILHYKYTVSTDTWASVATVIAGTCDKVTLGADGDTLYCFYSDDDQDAEYIYYKVYDGSWGSQQVLKSTSTVVQNGYSCYEFAGNNEMGVIWTEGAGSPYDIKFAKFSTSDPEPWAKQAIAVTAGEDYLFRGWMKSSAAGNQTKIELYDGTNDASIVDSDWVNNTSWNSWETCWEVPTGCTSAEVRLHVEEASEIVYYDQMQILPNVLDNGGFEGSYTDRSGGGGGTVDIVHNWNNGTLETDGSDTADESASSHTGDKCQYVLTDADGGGINSYSPKAVVEGAWYTSIIWVNVVSGTARIQFVTTNGYATLGNVYASTAGWTKYTRTYLWPNSGSLRVYVSAYGGAAEFYIDDISTVRLDAIPPTGETAPTAANSYVTGKWSDANGAFSVEGADALTYDNGSLDPNIHTISFWAYINNPYTIGTNLALFDCKGADENNREVIYYSYADDKWYVYINAGNRISTAAETDNSKFYTWIHIALTSDFTNDSYILYINGANVGSSSASLTAPNFGVNPIYVGTDNTVTYETDFYIDALRIFNRVLTPDEIGFQASASSAPGNSSVRPRNIPMN